MRAWTVVVVVAITGVLASLALAAPRFLRPPAAEVDLADRALIHEAVSTPYKRSGYTVDSDDGEVLVRRRELRDGWREQEQVLRAPYFIVEVDAGCAVDGEIASLHVAGLYPDGEACIEEWTFSYAPRTEPDVPLERRALPEVRRAELLRSSAYGRISSLEPDPSGRFVVFVTCDDPAVYRLARGAREPERIVGSEALPALADARRMIVRRHASEGLQFHLIEDLFGCVHPFEGERVVVVRADADGRLSSAETLTMEDWHARGYALPGPWIEPCP
jgi:hypothetical protein